MERRKRRRRRVCDEIVTRMDAERLVKISKDNMPAGRRSPGRPEKKMERLNAWLKQAKPSITKKMKNNNFFVIRNQSVRRSSAVAESRVRSPAVRADANPAT